MILPSRELMPVICAALERGQQVRLTATGSSMQPFLFDGDVIALEACPWPKVGDIVLVRGATGRLVLHRVARRVDDAFYVVGDAQREQEGPFGRRALLGRAVLVFREERAIRLDRGVPWLAGRIWMRSGSRGRVALLWAARVRALGRRLVRRISLKNAKGATSEGDRCP